MKYSPYSPKWTRYRMLQEAIYDYLQDPDTLPEEICEIFGMFWRVGLVTIQVVPKKVKFYNLFLNNGRPTF
jgi:hypothetical protein